MMSKKKPWKKPIIKHGKMTKYNYLVHYPENLKLGRDFDIGSFTFIQAQNFVEIQDKVQIGSHCSIYSKSTIDDKEGPVILKKNCKIGTHSTIMPNVKVEENSIVAAYSFVTRSIPKNQLWGGVPAKKLTKM